MRTEALSFCFLLSSSNLISESFFILWAHAAHTGTDFSFTRKVSKSVSKGTPLRYPRGCAPQWSNDHAPPYSINHHLCAQWFAFCFNSSDLRVLKPKLRTKPNCETALVLSQKVPDSICLT